MSLVSVPTKFAAVCCSGRLIFSVLSLSPVSVLFMSYGWKPVYAPHSSGISQIDFYYSPDPNHRFLLVAAKRFCWLRGALSKLPQSMEMTIFSR